MDATAVVMGEPNSLGLARLALDAPGPSDIVVAVDWSGISTGTERLLYEGRMPAFPGLGYPLVPGYEAVGRVVESAPDFAGRVGDAVFVPGARCFGAVRGLFGASASHLVVPAARAVRLEAGTGPAGVLLALAATARHAVAAPGAALPDLVVGHGVLGRLIARIVVALGGYPVVWESNPERRSGGQGYAVVDPATDARRDYAVACDASGDPRVLDTLIARLAPGGEVVLAGFYAEPLSFAFPPAFMREARIRVAAEWKQPDIAATLDLVRDGRLSLDGLVTHRQPARSADAAYRTAFGDPACLKMVLDWSALS